MTNRTDYEPNDSSIVTFGDWIYRPYRRFRQGLMTLARLETNLYQELEQFQRYNMSIMDVPAEAQYLKQSLIAIRTELRVVSAALLEVFRGVRRAGFSEDEILARMAVVLQESPIAQEILSHVENRGGPLHFLAHSFPELRAKEERFSRCIQIVDQATKSASSDKTLSQFALEVSDCVRPNPEEPDFQYSLLCIIKPLICVVVIVVIIATESTIDPDPPDDKDDPPVGDFPEPNPDEIPA